MNKIIEPSHEALQHSLKLRDIIFAEIENSGGKIPFARFMELALYAPGLGYYSAGAQKFGEQGDFVTAPELSPLFAQCLARQCSQVLEQLGKGDILELGAGSGVLACELLQELARQHCLPEHYFILEVSAELRERQKRLLSEKIPYFVEKVIWLDCLPEKPIKGVIMANEVLDAMPVNFFRLTAEQVIQEFYVSRDQDDFAWHLDMPSNALLTEQVKKLNIITLNHYDSEINLLLSPWLKSISQCLAQGLVLLIDYGFPRHEYYHPDRAMGTLMCHYRHHAHTDPFKWIGLQDITAHVDFTAVAEEAVAADLQVTGFTTQAAFLLNCGLLNLIPAARDGNIKQQLLINQQIQKLTSPAEMGELFKVIALTRGLEELDLLGFTQHDQRVRL